MASPTSFGGSLTALTNQSINVNIDYDVVALATDLAIGGARTFQSSLYGGFLYGTSVATTVDGGNSGLLDLLLTSSAFGAGSESDSFDTPAGQVHVHHSIQLSDVANFYSFDSVTLRAVPVPGSLALLGSALADTGVGEAEGHPRKLSSRRTATVSLDVLHLLPHLLDEDLEVDRLARGLGVG